MIKLDKNITMDIFKAARTGDLNALAACLQSGESINAQDSKGMTPLMWAVDLGRPLVVKYLVAAKANLDLVDSFGQTALILAAGRNDLTSLQVLIVAKANLNIKMVTGVSALTVALENDHHQAAALLKKAGAK